MAGRWVAWYTHLAASQRTHRCFVWEVRKQLAMGGAVLQGVACSTSGVVAVGWAVMTACSSSTRACAAMLVVHDGCRGIVLRQSNTKQQCCCTLQSPPRDIIIAQEGCRCNSRAIAVRLGNSNAMMMMMIVTRNAACVVFCLWSAQRVHHPIAMFSLPPASCCDHLRLRAADL